MQIPIRSSITNILLTLFIDLLLIGFIGSTLIARAENAMMRIQLQRKGSTSLKKFGHNPRTYGTVLKITMLFLFIVLELGVAGVSEPKKEPKKIKSQNRIGISKSYCSFWHVNGTICETNSRNISLTELEKGSLEINEEAAEKCLEKLMSGEGTESYVFRFFPDYREDFSNDLHCATEFSNRGDVLSHQGDNFYHFFSSSEDMETKKKVIQNIAKVFSTPEMNVTTGSWQCSLFSSKESSLRRKSVENFMEKSNVTQNGGQTLYVCNGSYVQIMSKEITAKLGWSLGQRIRFDVYFNDKWIAIFLESFLDFKAIHAWMRSDRKSKELLLWYFYGRPWNDKSFPIKGLDDFLFEYTEERTLIAINGKRFLTEIKLALVFGSIAMILLLLSLVAIIGYKMSSSGTMKPLDLDWWVSAWALERAKQDKFGSVQGQNEFVLPESSENSLKITTLVMESKICAHD